MATARSGQKTTPPRSLPIGPWVFDIADGTLRGPDGERKVEDRAARTLALLCAHRGEIVSQAMILETVWRGRQVSPNSVAVVVADLRRALGDDARDPAYIETVAKRGYRLKGNPPPAYSNAADDIRALPRRRLTYLVAAIGLVGVVTASASWMGHARADLRITIEPVRNDTGAESYGPLADAMSELLVNRISTFTAVKIYRQVGMERIDARTQGLVVQSKLILWNGIPTLSMTSEDGRGHVVWTGMVMGPPDTLAKDDC